MKKDLLEKEDFHQDTEFKKVLSFSFATNILFRCTIRKYAEDFKNGRLRFNQPKYWISEEEKGNKGLGDCLEGVFLVAKENDNSSFILSMKNNSEYEHFVKSNKLYFRRKNIKELYCFCLYGLNDNSFVEKNIDRFGMYHFISRIDKNYFSSFANNVTKENYFQQPDAEKPVLVFINNPHEFFEKIRNFFIQLGIPKKDIIISPVEYVDLNKPSISLVSYPHELLLKDIYFKNQSEIRIVLNSTSSKLKEYMKNNNNIIDIGNIENIVTISDYYFHDMLLEKNGNELLYTLPFPKKQMLMDLSLREILAIFVQVYNDKLPYETTEDERLELIEVIKDTISKKYNMLLSVENGQLNLKNVSGNIEDLLDL